MNTRSLILHILAIAALAATSIPSGQAATTPTPLALSIDTAHPVASFVPSEALGAAVDGYEKGDIAKIYTKANVKAMLSAGFQPITYRLRTELGIEAWHWNPSGRWSNRRGKCGYWTSSDKPGRPIEICNGYKLPRRGDTFDQANNSGYSRIDDGDVHTFWKSNPYLSKPFAPEDHPQWIVVELPKNTKVDALRIDWGAPYATRYAVQYWLPDNPNDDPHPPVLYQAGHIDATLYQRGHWQNFPLQSAPMRHQVRGTHWEPQATTVAPRVRCSRPTPVTPSGAQVIGKTIRLADTPIATRVIRIVLEKSSGTSAAPSTDIRDRLGYAVRELYIGTIDNNGRFHDILRHGTARAKQSIVYVSSTDPWHRAVDIDRDVEQPGFDRIYRNGITRGLPMMLPVGLAYDTAENAVAEIAYLRRRGYPIGKIEMGEEPDGQYMTPEDYGALYIEWARALHRVDRRLKLGGPCYQTMAWQEAAWPDGTTETSWSRRFIDYLTSHGRLADLSFFSSEFYFYNDVCSPPSPKLTGMPKLVDDAFARWKLDGVPTSIPWYATEYGYSPYAAEPEVDLPGALLDADLIAHYLSIGGAGLYFYGIEPNTPIKEVAACDTYGNLALWQSDDDREIVAPFAAYWVIRLVTHEWSQVGDRRVTLYPVHLDSPTSNGAPVVTAYAARRADGRLSLMMINKSATASFTVKPPIGRSRVFQYSRRNYVWHPRGENGYASPNRPPDEWNLAATGNVILPPFSITVIRTVDAAR